VNVAVIGTGHVGLVTCVTFSSIGHDVIGTDVDAEKIELLTRGVSPFFEPGLDEALQSETAAGRLSFTVDAEAALGSADVVFICVGTPARADGEANLVAMERTASSIARYAPDDVVVVEKSTVPAGTADRVRLTLEREGGRSRFHMASNPEFLREGSAMHDALEPDRIVIGVESDHGLDVLRKLYAPIIDSGVPLIVTDIRTAELAKHASNAFLALKISFANALARVCERADADVAAVADIMGSDARIGRAFLDAGLGYGGYCFPKDVAALAALSERLGYRFPMLREVQRVNDEAVEAVAAKVRDGLWNLEGKRVALLGLAFKPDTDDIRFSPALALARSLLGAGAHVVGYDPRAALAAKEELPELELANDPYEAASRAHALVIGTDWKEFRDVDLETLREVMTYPLVIDGRNLLDREDFVGSGFWYYPTGRPPVVPEPTRAEAEGSPGRGPRDARAHDQRASIT
jgi:UDPglucose 6-dehydrogenase